MTLRVALVELPLYDNTLPLTSGYLQAYVRQDPTIAGAIEWSIHARAAHHPRESLLAELLEADADVYAISCYLWNMRRIRWLLDHLRARRPDAHLILGGPQVMEHLADYVQPGTANVAICNGEGERTFAAYLGQLHTGQPDLSQVPGLSYQSGDTLVTTEKPARIKDLDEVPSPFAAGIFDGGEYTFAVVETNRGCPFRCSYCYWGAATNDKVYSWNVARVEQDLTWISEHGVESIFIADANWGALPRDVELTRHIVRCKERNGYPLMVSMQAAKNRPDRVTQITEILVDGGLLASQPVSLQTLSPLALKAVDRTNIRETTYVQLQSTLREKRISSYTELIWPLPGETLASFQSGIGRLCRSGADAIVTYPQLLLRNTPMEQHREALGIRTERVADDIAEADVVVQTSSVSRPDFDAGIWFYYATVVLYNARCAFYLARYAEREGKRSYEHFLGAAARYFQRRQDVDLCRFFADSVAQLASYDINNVGKVLHQLLRSHRAEVDRLLADFLRDEGLYGDHRLRGLFELDLIARPYVYREPVVRPAVELTEVRIVGQDRYHYLVDVPADLAETLAGLDRLGLPAPTAGALRVRVDHLGRRKMPYPRHRSLDHNASYCQAMMNRLRDILPTWTALSPAPAPAR